LQIVKIVRELVVPVRNVGSVEKAYCHNCRLASVAPSAIA